MILHIIFEHRATPWDFEGTAVRVCCSQSFNTFFLVTSPSVMSNSTSLDVSDHFNWHVRLSNYLLRGPSTWCNVQSRRMWTRITRMHTKTIRILSITSCLPSNVCSISFGGTLKWLTCHADEKNESLRTLIKKKIEEYLLRAEQLKKHLSNSEEKRSRRAVGANGASTGGTGGSGKRYVHQKLFPSRQRTNSGMFRKDDDDDDQDPELKKLRAGLTGNYRCDSHRFQSLQSPSRGDLDGQAKCEMGRCCRTGIR